MILVYYIIFNLLPVLILHNNHEKHNRNKNLKFSENYLIFGNKKIWDNDIENINVYGTYQSINKNRNVMLSYGNCFS